ncbi:MAG: formimidoylglutamase [Wenzhouxiangellaceae bacterium]
MNELIKHRWLVPGRWPRRRPGRFASRIIDLHASPDLYAQKDAPIFEAAGHAFRGVGLLGLADDEGVRLNGGRLGARQGPNAFREGLAGYGAADSVGLEGLQVPVYDVGDVVPGASLDQTHARVTAIVGSMLDVGLMPVGIGGGHDLTWPEVRAVIDRLIRPGDRSLHGVYFDAHLDVREQPGSGMPFRALLEYGGVQRLDLFGFDPLVNSPAHLNWFLAHGGVLADWPPDAWPESEACFVSVCLDAIEMSQAPGVSAPSPTGLDARTVADYVEAAGRNPSVCCLDIMELSPPHDEHGRTARLAAALFLRFLKGLSDRC